MMWRSGGPANPREGLLSFGNARKLAGLSKHEFGQLLGERSVERHYGSGELEEDLRYACGEAEAIALATEKEAEGNGDTSGKAPDDKADQSCFAFSAG